MWFFHVVLFFFEFFFASFYAPFFVAVRALLLPLLHIKCLMRICFAVATTQQQQQRIWLQPANMDFLINFLLFAHMRTDTRSHGAHKTKSLGTLLFVFMVIAERLTSYLIIMLCLSFFFLYTRHFFLSTPLFFSISSIHVRYLSLCLHWNWLVSFPFLFGFLFVLRVFAIIFCAHTPRWNVILVVCA